MQLLRQLQKLEHTEELNQEVSWEILYVVAVEELSVRALEKNMAKGLCKSQVFKKKQERQTKIKRNKTEESLTTQKRYKLFLGFQIRDNLGNVIGERNVDKAGEIALTAFGYGDDQFCVCFPCMPSSQILFFIMLAYVYAFGFKTRHLLYIYLSASNIYDIKN